MTDTTTETEQTAFNVAAFYEHNKTRKGKIMNHLQNWPLFVIQEGGPADPVPAEDG
jgi:hypothetical protein